MIYHDVFPANPKNASQSLAIRKQYRAKFQSPQNARTNSPPPPHPQYSPREGHMINGVGSGKKNAALLVSGVRIVGNDMGPLMEYSLRLLPCSQTKLFTTRDQTSPRAHKLLI